MCNIAVVSVHTSPLARPGTRDSGGLNVYVRELSREMVKRGHTIDIFTRRTDADTPEITVIDPKTRVIQVKAGPMDADKATQRRYLETFRQGVMGFTERDRRVYDLVHSHYWMSGWVGQTLAECWEAPHVVMFHTLARAKNSHYLAEREPNYRIAAERVVARGADRIIAASDSESETLVDQYRVRPGRVAVVPCGVDTVRFRPMNRERAKLALGLDPSLPVLLFVGRIESLKGIDVLIRAAAEIESGYQLLVVGGDDRDAARMSALDELVVQTGISGAVRFLEAAPHDDLPGVFNAADICVVPSYYESFGLVALEAMACGVPVIASRVGGLKETITDGQSGYLVPWRCPEPFAERLDLLLTNESLRKSMGLRARETAEEYAWPIVAGQVEEIYHELVSEYRGVAVGAHVA
jgi:D-inositol-3-phosphate glycosyltransferase